MPSLINSRAIPWRRRDRSLSRLPLAFLLAALLGGQLDMDAAAQESGDSELPPAVFSEITSDDLVAARHALGASLVAAERLLESGPADAEAWKTYLLWSGLQQQLSVDADPDFTALRTAYDRLTSGQPGLEQREFQEVRDAVARLEALGLVRRARDQSAYLEKQSRILRAAITRDPSGLDPRASRQVEARLALFASTDQARELTSDIDHRLRRDNLVVVASQRLLDRLARRPVAETRPLADSILGTRIVGDGDTRGWISLDLVPSAAAARLNFRFTGRVDSLTRGYNGPVVIRSQGETHFQGVKTVELTDDRFRVLAAGLRANTASKTRSITKTGGRLGKRLVEKIAHKRVNEARGQANAIASRKAEQQIAAEFDEQVTEEVRQARRQYDDTIRKPLRRRGAAPERLAFSTSSDRLTLTVLQATPGQLGAGSPPPPADACDLSLRLHQSSLNNLADAMIGGATIRQDAADKRPQIDAVLPDRVREALTKRTSKPPAKQPPGDEAADEPFTPWAVELRRERPVSFMFEGGVARVLVHTARIASGEQAFRGWDIELAYRLVSDNGRWFAEQVGEVDVLPTSFDPAVAGSRMTSRQRALRRNLAKQLTARVQSGGLPARIELKPIDLAKLDKPGLGELVIKKASVDAGWLSLAFDAQ